MLLPIVKGIASGSVQGMLGVQGVGTLDLMSRLMLSAFTSSRLEHVLMM